MRHPESLEYQATFMDSGAYRFTRGSNCTGRPKVHWAESSLTEATARLEHSQSDAAPAHGDINHSFYQIPSLDQIRISHGSQGIAKYVVMQLKTEGNGLSLLINLKSHVYGGVASGRC